MANSNLPTSGYSHKKKNFQRLLRGIGISQIVLAGLIIGTAIALVIFHNNNWHWYYNYDYDYYSRNIGSGIWCTFFVFPTAILTLIASKKLTPCLLTWTFASSLLSVIFMITTLALSAVDGIKANSDHGRQSVTAVNIAICGLVLPQIVLALYICATFGYMICCSKYEITASDMFGTCSCCQAVCSGQQQPYRGLVNSAQGQFV
uniref:Membrane-spanning 4-domains subfamily A member 18-like n=1 Tax=Phallusia mammillata TaxID=59560 RepID=A0A6F9DLK6_9ASCI|nr:membrane-spanning 4-domains subfamily A member 18-like [Phallusia mammillata]